MNNFMSQLSYIPLGWVVATIITTAILILLFIDNIKKRRRINKVEHLLIIAENNAHKALITKKDFLADLSHQIRTALNGVIGMTRLLQNSALNAEQQSYANIIALSSLNLLEMLNGLGNLSKIERGAVAQQIPVINLAEPKILVITDSKTGHYTIEQQLKEADVEADTANTFPDGLEMLLSAVQNYVSYDMVIFDQLSETTDYFKFGRLIKNNAKICATSILLLSPNFTGNDLHKAQKAGFNGYLKKPVGSSEIILGLAMIWAQNIAKIIEKNSQTHLSIPFLTRRILREKRNCLKVAQKAAQNLHGIRILLVEDNLVSHMVAKRTLNLCGCIVTGAENGLDAINLVKEKPFDIIFMDCRMPGLDGYSATQEIIAHEKKHHLTHTPIIALTANVMKGDAEKCFAAGMDDYIAKPIQSDIIIDIILRWLGPKLIIRAQQDKEDQKTPLIDLATLERLKLMTGNDFIPILESYIAVANSGIQSISDAITAKDAITLRREFHSLKSSSQQVGALQIGVLSAQLEEMALAENFTGILAPFNLFSTLHEQVESDLKAYIKMTKPEELSLSGKVQ